MTFFLLFCNDSDMFFYRKLPTIILCEHYTSFLQPLCIYSHHVHLTVIVKRFSSSHTDFPHLACHVCSEDGDGDSRLTRDQSRSRLFQLNPPKKINTAGSASAACNNTIRGKGREFGQLQIHTHTLTNTKMTFMVWMVCCGSSYTLCPLSSPKMVWKIRKGKCYWVVTGRTASAAPQHYR